MYIQVEQDLYIVGGGDTGPGISSYKDCNVYLIVSGGQGILFDAGSGLDTSMILNNIQETGVQLSHIKYLFITHCHGDHTGGVRDMKAAMPNLTVVTSGKEAKLMEAGTEDQLGLTAAKVKGAYPGNYTFHHQRADRTIQNGEIISMPDITVEAVMVPGHSIESVCYLMDKRDRRYLFSGDSVYKNGALSLQNCYGSSMKNYRRYLPRLANRHIDALIPAHFGFTLTGGQTHVDKALEYLKSSALPPMV